MRGQKIKRHTAIISNRLGVSWMIGARCPQVDTHTNDSNVSAGPGTHVKKDCLISRFLATEWVFDRFT